MIQTYAFLVAFKPEETTELKRHIEVGGKLPGWGNSFHKGEPDEMWRDVDAHISEHWPELHNMVKAVTEMLHSCGKMVYPNPSAYTALTAIILEMPPEIIGWILVQGRLSEWTRIFGNSIAEMNKPKEKEGELV